MRCPICNNECTISTWTFVISKQHIIDCPNCYFSLKSDTEKKVMETYRCLSKTKHLLDQLIALSDQLPNPAKLRLIAEWFDVYDSKQKNTNDEVQRELRDWSEVIMEMKKLC